VLSSRGWTRGPPRKERPTLLFPSFRPPSFFEILIFRRPKVRMLPPLLASPSPPLISFRFPPSALLSASTLSRVAGPPDRSTLNSAPPLSDRPNRILYFFAQTESVQISISASSRFCLSSPALVHRISSHPFYALSELGIGAKKPAYTAASFQCEER